MDHDRGQIAVAPLSQTQFLRALESGSIPSPTLLPSNVGKIIGFEPRSSQPREVIYYLARGMVDRGWLETMVRILTDPPTNP